MAFDWGGFAGGIIGTFGAFAAAVYAIHRQENLNKPQRFKERMQAAESLLSFLSGMGTEIIFDDYTKLDDLVTKAQNLTGELKKLSTNYIVAGFDLADIIYSIHDQVEKLHRKYFQDGIATEEEKIDKYMDEVLEPISTGQQRCREIIAEMKKDIEAVRRK